MAETTGIAWCDHTWSPWIGCTRVSPGCDHCYAEALDARHRYGGAVHWGAGVPRYQTKSWGVPRTLDKRAKLAGARRTIFPSLCDPFDNEVPEEWRESFFELIANTPHLIWLLLTKRIGNVRKMLPWWWDDPKTWLTTSDKDVYPQVWLGASVVNQEEADRDIPKLLATPAAKRFVSYEPALGPIDFRQNGGLDPYPLSPRLDWIIVGGESAQGGAKARPFEVSWAHSTIAQCGAAGVPVFVKQLGSRPYWPGRDHGIGCALKDRAGADPAEWPEDLRVQEFVA